MTQPRARREDFSKAEVEGAIQYLADAGITPNHLRRLRSRPHLPIQVALLLEGDGVSFRHLTREGFVQATNLLFAMNGYFYIQVWGDSRTLLYAEPSVPAAIIAETDARHAFPENSIREVFERPHRNRRLTELGNGKFKVELI